ncbi:MAG: response regulator transcription factor [Lachnospiraceae bacterium]|nr:response regulator transcription factor [Lachnospiraceae bacterium]
MADILVVEDNLEMGTLLCDFLQAEGYSTEHCTDGLDAVDMFVDSGAKLVILDIMLPHLDGYGICKKIRETSNAPIIMVSAKNMKDDKLKGLLLGADDYIEKPYDIDILIAKVKGIFSRRYSSDILSDGFLKINKLRHTVSISKNASVLENNVQNVSSITGINSMTTGEAQEIELTQKEFELLTLLVENAGKTMNKDFLFNKIWGIDSDSEQQTLTVHIKWLRQKIEEDPKNPKHIITVWGVGYRYE